MLSGREQPPDTGEPEQRLAIDRCVGLAMIATVGGLQWKLQYRWEDFDFEPA